MIGKRDGATVAASPEDIAWELVKMVCRRKQQIYSDREAMLRGIVDAYRLMTGESDGEWLGSLAASES
jgi:hypothetical protein